MTAQDVPGDDKGSCFVTVALELDEVRRLQENTGTLTGQVAVAPVEDLLLVERDLLKFSSGPLVRLRSSASSCSSGSLTSGNRARDQACAQSEGTNKGHDRQGGHGELHPDLAESDCFSMSGEHPRYAATFRQKSGNAERQTFRLDSAFLARSSDR